MPPRFRTRLLASVLALGLLGALGLWLVLRAAPHPAAPLPAPQPAAALQIQASSTSATLQFNLAASAPAGVAETIFWLDTPAGHTPQRTAFAGQTSLTQTIQITPDPAGLADHLRPDGTLDYWWAVRTGGGDIVQAAGTVALDPALAARALPTPTRLAPDWAWRTAASPHVRFFYAPDSAAERDIGQLMTIAEAAYSQASAVISPALMPWADPSRPLSLTVYLVPRVFWQGGVAYGDGIIAISYLDRNYTGVESWSYFVHEMIHGLAGLQAADERINIGNLLGEGIAVYGTGGHYQREDIQARAAALERSGQLIQLCPLRITWWEAQHETAYLQGASFDGYLIERFGLRAFLDHYLRRQPALPRDTDPAAACPEFNQRLAEPFGRTFGDLEADWRAMLSAMPLDPAADRDWAATVRYYELMRRYQATFDPVARRLPTNPQHWDATVTLSYTTRPLTPAAVLRETMFLAADEALRSGDHDHAGLILDELAAFMATPALTATLGQEYAAVDQLLGGYARARRLGLPLAPFFAPDAPEHQHEPGLLYRDFELSLQRLDIRSGEASGVVEIASRTLDQPQPARQLYAFTALRQGEQWRLSAITPTALAQPLPPGASAVLGQ